MEAGVVIRQDVFICGPMSPIKFILGSIRQPVFLSFENPSLSHVIAYKVTPSHPEHFIVKRRWGIIGPRQTACIIIDLHSQVISDFAFLLENEQHFKFQFLTILAPADLHYSTTTQDVFSNANPNDIKLTELSCVFQVPLPIRARKVIQNTPKFLLLNELSPKKSSKDDYIVQIEDVEQLDSGRIPSNSHLFKFCCGFLLGPIILTLLFRLLVSFTV